MAVPLEPRDWSDFARRVADRRARRRWTAASGSSRRRTSLIWGRRSTPSSFRTRRRSLFRDADMGLAGRPTSHVFGEPRSSRRPCTSMIPFVVEAVPDPGPGRSAAVRDLADARAADRTRPSIHGARVVPVGPCPERHQWPGAGRSRRARHERPRHRGGAAVPLRPDDAEEGGRVRAE